MGSRVSHARVGVEDYELSEISFHASDMSAERVMWNLAHWHSHGYCERVECEHHMTEQRYAALLRRLAHCWLLTVVQVARDTVSQSTLLVTPWQRACARVCRALGMGGEVRLGDVSAATMEHVAAVADALERVRRCVRRALAHTTPDSVWTGPMVHMALQWPDAVLRSLLLLLPWMVRVAYGVHETIGENAGAPPVPPKPLAEAYACVMAMDRLQACAVAGNTAYVSLRVEPANGPAYRVCVYTRCVRRLRQHHTACIARVMDLTHPDLRTYNEVLGLTRCMQAMFDHMMARERMRSAAHIVLVTGIPGLRVALRNGWDPRRAFEEASAPATVASVFMDLLCVCMGLLRGGRVLRVVYVPDVWDVASSQLTVATCVRASRAAVHDAYVPIGHGPQSAGLRDAVDDAHDRDVESGDVVKLRRCVVYGPVHMLALCGGTRASLQAHLWSEWIQQWSGEHPSWAHDVVTFVAALLRMPHTVARGPHLNVCVTAPCGARVWAHSVVLWLAWPAFADQVAQLDHDRRPQVFHVRLRDALGVVTSAFDLVHMVACMYAGQAWEPAVRVDPGDSIRSLKQCPDHALPGAVGAVSLSDDTWSDVDSEEYASSSSESCSFAWQSCSLECDVPTNVTPLRNNDGGWDRRMLPMLDHAPTHDVLVRVCPKFAADAQGVVWRCHQCVLRQSSHWATLLCTEDALPRDATGFPEIVMYQPSTRLVSLVLGHMYGCDTPVEQLLRAPVLPWDRERVDRMRQQQQASSSSDGGVVSQKHIRSALQAWVTVGPEAGDASAPLPAKRRPWFHRRRQRHRGGDDKGKVDAAGFAGGGLMGASELSDGQIRALDEIMERKTRPTWCVEFAGEEDAEEDGEEDAAYGLGEDTWRHPREAPAGVVSEDGDVGGEVSDQSNWHPLFAGIDAAWEEPDHEDERDHHACGADSREATPLHWASSAVAVLCLADLLHVPRLTVDVACALRDGFLTEHTLFDVYEVVLRVQRANELRYACMRLVPTSGKERLHEWAAQPRTQRWLRAFPTVVVALLRDKWLTYQRWETTYPAFPLEWVPTALQPMLADLMQ